MRISDWSSDVCSSDLRPVRRFEHAVPQLAQDFDGMLTHGFIVLDDKHCLGAIAAGQFFDAPRELDGLLLGKKARQIDLYRRALLDLAVDLHVAARLLDEPIDLEKAARSEERRGGKACGRTCRNRWG